MSAAQFTPEWAVQWLRMNAADNSSDCQAHGFRQTADLIERLKQERDDAFEARCIAEDEYRSLKGLINAGLSVDGEMIPLIIDGGLEDRSVGISEPPFLALPDELDQPVIWEAFAKARGE